MLNGARDAGAGVSMQFADVRERLNNFEFGDLFVENLGWARPPAGEKKARALVIKGESYERRAIAELGGVMVFEITSANGRIPDAERRKQVDGEIEKQFHEHLLVFVDADRAQSLWYWVKREGKVRLPRSHLYVANSPGDLLLGKLDAMHFDIAELDDVGSAPVVEVAHRLRKALDVEKVTRRFYEAFQKLHEAFIEGIEHVAHDRDKRWYASVLLNRLMFVYFLQKRGFLLGDQDYLQRKLADSKARGRDRFFAEFLKPLFFEGFAKPESMRDERVKRLIGPVRYLNGGLFLEHRIEERNKGLDVPDRVFDEAFALFAGYDWHLDATPGGDDRHINPDVLGYIFEKYINQKDFGAYYTRPQITDYLCEKTIQQVILDRVNGPPLPMAGALGLKPRNFASYEALILNLDDELAWHLFKGILPKIRLLDPACGSGAFLVASMKTLIGVYAAVIGRIKVGANATLKAEIAELERTHGSLGYLIRREIISNNLYGVDLMEEATEIAKLRLFLALVATAENEDQLEPLPNIDFNILPGNSLLGLLHVKDADFNRKGATREMFRKTYAQLLQERSRLVGAYRDAVKYSPDLTALRDDIDQKKRDAGVVLDQILLEEFVALGLKYEQATWDEKKETEGKAKKRALKLADVSALRPFHWGYEFDEIVNGAGGFDVIIMNPPWDAFKPDDKEFFEDYSELVSKKKMTIKDFEKEKQKLLEDDPGLRQKYCDYLSGFPHVSGYFRGAAQYAHQTSVVNGKRVGTDTNLYKLFVEQCVNLLRPGGQAGIVVPAGLYNDQGAKALRELLFDGGEVRALFGLSNERYLFEEVHHSVKFCILVFGKGGKTGAFEAAFRINPREAVAADQLDVFLRAAQAHVTLTPELVRKLSPTTVSIMEFRGPTDIEIAEKMMQFPALEQESDVGWTLVLRKEFHSTGHKDLFRTSESRARLPLFEGKTIAQYSCNPEVTKYWIDEKDGRAELLRNRADPDTLDYQTYRLAFRDIARNTDSRTMIATILPRNVFCVDMLNLETSGHLDVWSRFYLLAIFDSFTIDYLLRQRVNAHVSFFFAYNLPVPRLPSWDPKLRSIALRAAKLVCTGPEFDDLARDVGLRDHREGAADFATRARLRAEIDGLVAHLYGLTEAEFLHVLSTFPVVPDPEKVAAHNAYRDVQNGLLR